MVMQVECIQWCSEHSLCAPVNPSSVFPNRCVTKVEARATCVEAGCQQSPKEACGFVPRLLGFIVLEDLGVVWGGLGSGIVSFLGEG